MGDRRKVRRGEKMTRKQRRALAKDLAVIATHLADEVETLRHRVAKLEKALGR